MMTIKEFKKIEGIRRTRTADANELVTLGYFSPLQVSYGLKSVRALVSLKS